MSNITWYELAEDNREDVIARTEKIRILVIDWRLNILEIGKQLTEVQDILAKPGKGSFVSWLAEEFGWSQRTAYNFIAVYQRFGDFANFAKMKIDPSALYRLSAKSTPQEAYDKAIQLAKDGEIISLKRVNSIISDYKPKPESTADFEQQNETQLLLDGIQPQLDKADDEPISVTQAAVEVENESEAISGQMPIPAPSPQVESNTLKTESQLQAASGTYIRFGELDSLETILRKLRFLYGNDILCRLNQEVSENDSRSRGNEQRGDRTGSR